jgi:hypothetical protein
MFIYNVTITVTMKLNLSASVGHHRFRRLNAAWSSNTNVYVQCHYYRHNETQSFGHVQNIQFLILRLLPVRFLQFSMVVTFSVLVAVFFFFFFCYCYYS